MLNRKIIRSICISLIAILISSCSSNNSKILIIGDSVSFGYTPYVKKGLSKVADVYHIEENARHTEYGLEKIESWLGENNWDLIQFNWGLWDITYRIEKGDHIGSKDKLNGQQSIPITIYKKNLDSLARVLKSTGAKLVFVTTTYVPKNEPGIYSEDVQIYNSVALEIMNDHQIQVNDIYMESRDIHQFHCKSENNLHYTKRGYHKLGLIVSAFLEEQLQSN